MKGKLITDTSEMPVLPQPSVARAGVTGEMPRRDGGPCSMVKEGLGAKADCDPSFDLCKN